MGSLVSGDRDLNGVSHPDCFVHVSPYRCEVSLSDRGDFLPPEIRWKKVQFDPFRFSDVIMPLYNKVYYYCCSGDANATQVPEQEGCFHIKADTDAGH